MSTVHFFSILCFTIVGAFWVEIQLWRKTKPESSPLGIIAFYYLVLIAGFIIYFPARPSSFADGAIAILIILYLVGQSIVFGSRLYRDKVITPPAPIIVEELTYCERCSGVMTGRTVCCGRVVKFDQVMHLQALINNANAWANIWTTWKDKPEMLEVIKEREARGQYSAVAALNTFFSIAYQRYTQKKSR